MLTFAVRDSPRRAPDEAGGGEFCCVVPRRGLLLARRWVLRADLARRIRQRGLRRVRLTRVRLARLVAGRLTLRILRPSWCAEDIHGLSGGQTEVRSDRSLQRGDLLPGRPRSHLDRSPLGGCALDGSPRGGRVGRDDANRTRAIGTRN